MLIDIDTLLPLCSILKFNFLLPYLDKNNSLYCAHFVHLFRYVENKGIINDKVDTVLVS